MTQRTLAAFGLGLALLAASVPGVGAATFPVETPFSQPAFEAAQKAGAPILVHITASWCTVCAAQKPILDKLRAEPRFKTLAVFNVDFDDQKKLVHRFGARMQSTLVAFRGPKETARSSGETQPAAIEALLATALR